MKITIPQHTTKIKLLVSSAITYQTRGMKAVDSVGVYVFSELQVKILHQSYREPPAEGVGALCENQRCCRRTEEPLCCHLSLSRSFRRLMHTEGTLC